MASASATSNPSAPSALKELVEFNTNTQLPIKLNSSNYPAWHKQINSLLIARDLVDSVTGETPCPPQTIGAGASASPNPHFSLWIRQDKLLYLALFGSCDPEARSVMSPTDTSCDAWLALQRAFSNRSRSRAMSLKERLSSISKGTSSISCFMQSIRFIADELALIGHPLDDLDLVIHTLNGLRPSFREIVASVRTRNSPILFDELHDKLVDFEMYLQREKSHATLTPVTANNAQCRHNGTGRGRHSVPHPSDPAASNNKKSSVVTAALVCQYCDKPGHSAKRCYKIHGYPSKSHPSANAAQATTSNPLSPHHWLLDSGASHHITNDFNNLSIKNNYTRNDHL